MNDRHNYLVKDSGRRQSFHTGAVRDTEESKPRVDLLSPFVLERVGAHMRRGAEKYSAWNWARGIPSSRFYASLMRHLTSYAEGKRDEDHLSAAMFNLMGLIHNEELCGQPIEIEAEPGEFHLLPKELLDFPKFRRSENGNESDNESDGETTDHSVIFPQESDGPCDGA